MTGCYISIGDLERAQQTLDKLPDMLDKKKIGGKDLPTEVFIRKKRAFVQSDFCAKSLCSIVLL